MDEDLSNIPQNKYPMRVQVVGANGEQITEFGGGEGGGGAVTIANGADIALGSTTDASSAAGGTGSLSAKARLMTSQLDTISTNTGTTGASAKQVQGNVAPGVADTGNSFKAGGVYRATLTTYGDGTRTEDQTDNKGAKRMVVANANTTDNMGFATSNNDTIGVDASNVLPKVRAFGTWFDRTLNQWVRATGTAAAGLFTNVSATPTNTSVSIATTSTSVLAANTNRKMIILSNTGTNKIYVRLSGGTATTTDMLLNPLSQPVMIDKWVPLTAITAIAETGATNLSVTEFA